MKGKKQVGNRHQQTLHSNDLSYVDNDAWIVLILWNGWKVDKNRLIFYKLKRSQNLGSQKLQTHTKEELQLIDKKVNGIFQTRYFLL